MAPTIAEFSHQIFGYEATHVKTYCNNTCNMDKLKPNLYTVTADISLMALQAVSKNMLCRAWLYVYIQHDGAQ